MKIAIYALSLIHIFYLFRSAHRQIIRPDPLNAEGKLRIGDSRSAIVL